MAGSYRVLDAYESLKLVAQRSGAPLCGQRAWISGNTVFAERGGSAMALATYSDPGYQMAYVNVFHGGKRIELDYGSLALAWSSGAWSVTSAGAGDQVEGGAFQSPAYSSDHDQTAGAGAPVIRRSTADVVRLNLYDASWNVVKTFEKSFPATRAPSSGIGAYTAVYSCNPSPCSFDHYEAGGLNYWGEWDEIASNWSLDGNPWDSAGGTHAAIAPQGNFALVTLAFVHHNWTVNAMHDCGDKTPVADRCQEITEKDSVTRSEVWRVDLTKAGSDSTAWSQVFAGGVGTLNRANAYLSWIGISEDGNQYMWGAASPVYQSAVSNNLAMRVVSCGSTGVLEWVEANPASGALGTVRRSVSVNGTDMCGGMFWGGATTSSQRGIRVPKLGPPPSP